jgi:hypothetical protein
VTNGAGVGGTTTGAGGVTGVGGECGVSACEVAVEYIDVLGPSSTPNRAPAACDLPYEEQPSWLCNSALCSQIYGSYQDASSCVDDGFGLSPDGRLMNPRGPDDLEVRSHVSRAGTLVACPEVNTGSVPLSTCSLGGMIGVQEGCGDPPEGMGGEIRPGAYALIEFVAYGTTSFPGPGSAVWQTLYLTESSALLLSFDFNNFDFSGTYKLERGESGIYFEPVCESQDPRYRPFPERATYTAYGESIEFFDPQRRVRARFEMVLQETR